MIWPSFDPPPRVAFIDVDGTLLAETMVEDPLADDIPESANAEYLADADGRRPRDYGVVGAYARMYAVAIGVLAVAFVVLLLLK